MFRIRTSAIVRATFAVVGFTILAQPSSAAGTTSAAFLRLGFGARATALGDAFTARADDASATYWNPAGMSLLPSRELLAEHDIHIQDISINRLAFVQPLGDSGLRSRKAVGLSLSSLSMGGIEARTGDTAQPDGSFGASDFYGAASYSQPLGESLTLGVTGKLIQQKIGSASASTYAADVGVLQRLGRFRVGAALTNLGPSMKFVDQAFPLPQALRGGVSYDAEPMPVRFSAEAESLKGESGATFRMGMEYSAGKMLALRGGYLSRSGATQSALTNKGTAGFVGMTGGFGLRAGAYALDYAFVPYGELGSSHKMSFSVRF
jgi:hypothetical protein